ncbi:mitochondrial ribosomal protein subunit L20-domain-containing protein [Biscogniauxia mediterranea]|nr:mitochondrial ribosomal protein subunit L20-domain-containing protein [Biscogniauxia mediterranea]
METRQLLRPLGSCCRSSGSLNGPTANAAAAAMGRRHQSSTARTKKMLKIPPHPSFLTSPEGMNRVIYNPPSATPSVYHTPFKFLPPSDPRRQANLSQIVRSSLQYQAEHPPPPPPTTTTTSSSSSSDAASLPPTATKADEHTKQYNVSREEVEEMRALRAADPARWSVVRLAERFKCSRLFVMMCCRASREHRDQERERLEAIRARWGPIRTEAREERQKRRKMLLRDEL